MNNYDDKKINYQAFKNINEININNEIYEKIKNINETTDLKNKIISILDLYTNINKDNYEINKNINTKKEKEKENDIITINNKEKLNKMTIVYNRKKKNIIKLFGKDFVSNNIDNCYLLIDGVQKTLCENYIFSIYEIQRFEIELIETKPITDMQYMFCRCDLLESLPDISNWDMKNVTIYLICLRNANH